MLNALSLSIPPILSPPLPSPSLRRRQQSSSLLSILPPGRWGGNVVPILGQPRGGDPGGWILDTDRLLYPGVARRGGRRVGWHVHRRCRGRAVGDAHAVGHPLAGRGHIGRHPRADHRPLTLRLAHPQLILPLLFLLQVNLRVERLTGFRLLQHTHKPTVSLEPWL